MTEGRRIVLVDNDAAVLDLLLLDLRLEGHDVVATAADFDDAVAACEATLPDVLVVDLRLGTGPDGLDVAERVRRPGLRIVLHTNYVNPAVVSRARALGVTVVDKGSLIVLRKAITG